jgi:Leucine-rich repeat (LRR) protein
MSGSERLILNFWKKNLGSVPAEVWDQRDAVVLILADNCLTEISPRIGGLTSLRTLDLGHNRLHCVPEEIGNLAELSDFLYLHDNRLDSLPASIERLQKLRYLNISQNLFSDFPSSICSLSNLFELRATDNQLSTLPESIAGLSKLRELHLRNNRLTTLPSEIGSISELRQIDLRGNPLESLPGSIAELPRLEKLDLRWVSTLQPPAWLATLEARGCLVYR